MGLLKCLLKKLYNLIPKLKKPDYNKEHKKADLTAELSVMPDSAKLEDMN